LIRLRIFGCERGHQDVHRRLRFLDTHARPQPAEQIHRPRFAVSVQPALGVRVEDAVVLDCDIAVHLDASHGAAEGTLDHSGDDGWRAIDADGCPDDARITAEVLQPERIPEDDVDGGSRTRG